MNDEMNAALDELGIPGGDEPPINEYKETVVPAAIEPEPEPEPIKEPEPEPEANPKGFLDHAAYVEKNGNDDGWRGKDAYSAEYNRIQDNKSLRQEIKGMNDLLRQTVDATTSMQESAYQRGMTEAKTELDKAIEDDDVTAVIAAKDKMADLTPPQAAHKVNPIHSDFFTSNSVLDNASAQFDSEIMGEFERIYNGRLQADGVRQDQQLSDRAIQGYMNSALKSAKELFPDKFVSPRNSRQTNIPNKKRAAPTKSAADGIKSMHITTKNPRDTNALSDVYEEIKKRDPKEAERFAAKMEQLG